MTTPRAPAPSSGPGPDSSAPASAQPSPAPPSSARVVLRFVCFLTAVFSAFFAAHGVLMTFQFLDDDVPADTVVSLADRTKAGQRVRLDTGQTAVFRDAINDARRPVRLSPGDRYEKRGGTVTYLVNGRPITGPAWLVREWLFPPRVWVALAAYVVLGTAYTTCYRRLPLLDDKAAMAPRNRPRTPTGPPRPPPRRLPLPVQLTAHVLTWPTLVAAFTLLFGCLTSCLTGGVRMFTE